MLNKCKAGGQLRYFSGFLIVLCSVIFWLLPVFDSIYEWKTEPRTDTFYNVSTGVAVTTANVTLLKPIYDDDTGTLSFFSYDSLDAPAYVSFNATTRQLVFNGLAASTNRTMEISYDVTAFASGGGVFETLSDVAIYLLYIFFVVFPLGGLWVAFKPDIENIFS
jgi:hypothetical protein